MSSNITRAANAAYILNEYADITGQERTEDSLLTDLLTDIMHYCNNSSLFDFETELAMALHHFEAEKDEEADP